MPGGPRDAFASFMSVVATDSRPIRKKVKKSEKVRAWRQGLGFTRPHIINLIKR